MLGRKKTSSQNSARQTRIPVQRSENKEFFSYHAATNRDRDNAPNRQRTGAPASEKKRFNLQHIPVLLAVIGLSLSALYITTLQPSAVLRTEKNSVTLQSEKVYREYIEKTLSSSVMNKSKLTFDSKKFEQDMIREFPELSSVIVSIPLISHKPIVNLTAQQPVLLMGSEKGVFILNKNGQAIVKASANRPVEGLTVPLVRDDANIPIELGKGALTSQDVAFITSLVSQFENKKIGIDSLTLPPLASELHVKPTGEKYYIKFSLLTDPRIVTGQYFAARKKFTADNITPSEYVDSRVEEKVFFK